MRYNVPVELAALLGAPDDSRREDAWSTFLAQYSRLILHVCRSHGGDRDTVMDRYAIILERLRSDDFRRLRSWAEARRSKFTTWLTVVAQRASLDLYRQRYGRPRDDSPSALDDRAARRRLADLLAEEVNDDRASGDATAGTESMALSLRTAELRDALYHAVAELPGADQLLLLLRFRDSLSAAQIARTLGYPSPFHVYRQLDRLLNRLRTSLQARGIEDPVP